MADFSFLSDDSDNEKAVEELLSQAMDHSVLEQVAAINCSSFTDSLLPTHLETRFRKLKSLPTTTTSKPSNITLNSRSFCSSEFPKTKKSVDDCENNPVEEKVNSIEKIPHVGSGEDRVYTDLTPTSRVRRAVSEIPSIENDVFLKTPNGKKGKKAKALSSPCNSWDSSVDCLSPPTKTGCFWCSPKKKKGKENRGGVKWGQEDEFLSDLSSFSSKNQEKLLKKAMEEQEKINREAEKIVKWAKQASARMDVSSIEDELSDDDTFK